jgi:Spy/CpxP family protein refolding chaperone
MKIVRPFLCTALALSSLVLFGQPAVYAQKEAGKGQHAGEKHGRPLARLVKALNLTEDQKTKIKPILQEEHTQLKALRADTTLTPEQKKEKMKAIHQDSMAKIRPLLTAEQQQKLDTLKNKMKERREKRKDKNA